MAWDFCTEPEFQEKLDWIREFVEEEIMPLELVSRELTQPQLDALLAPFRQKVKDAGLWATHLGPEFGGQGMGQLKLALMHEILGRCLLAPDVFGNQAPDSGNAELLAAGADEAQKKRWLYPLMEGRMRSCFALTEPDSAGSDPTNIRTRCERDGDEWVLNGRKWFASNAGIADFLIVMAVSNPGEAPHKRAAMLVVPRDTPGLHIVRDIGTMAHPDASDGEILQRAGGHAELELQDCRVPLDCMIGKPGDGFLLAQKRLSGGRIHHGMRMIGQCLRAFEMMCERAVSREVRGRPLGEMQMVQDMIAEARTEIEAARLITLKAAWQMDGNADPREARAAIAMVKYRVPQALFCVLDRAIQIHGSLGYSTDLPLEEMYRQARALRIADGADEVHKQTIARHVLRDMKPVAGWPSEHVPTRRAAAMEKFGTLVEQYSANL